ncbi:MAG: hypothetical protein RLP14_10035 [Owenweeksia sp.]
MIQKLAFSVLLLFIIVYPSFGGPGDYIFGDTENPVYILHVGDDGYALFTEAIQNNTVGGVVNWDEVATAIEGYGPLYTPHKYLASGRVGVSVECCDIGNGYACFVTIPDDCGQCPCTE